MTVSEYWIEKTKLIEKEFDGWKKENEINVRKYILMIILSIPENGLAFYLNREQVLSGFVLDSKSSIDHNAVGNVYIIEKANTIIDKCFYTVDYEMLCEINADNAEKNTYTKNDVCDLVKKLVSKEKFDILSKKQKDFVACIEKIYFEPIGLINEYIEEYASSEVYYTILMEQWKTANEMAANISSQRNNMNNFYMSLMSILVGGIMFSDRLLDANIFAKTVLYLTIAFIGVVCCQKWIAQIGNYGKLNGAKYDVINELERQLPANVMLYEYMKTEKNARKEKNKINFSEQEREIAKLFRIVVVVVSIAMLIGVWWEKIWQIF